MRFVSAENLAVQHPRQKYVISKLCLAGTLRAGVNLAKRFANYLQITVVLHDNIGLRLTRIEADQDPAKILDVCMMFESAFICVHPRQLYSRPNILSRGSSNSSPRIRAAASSTA